MKNCDVAIVMGSDSDLPVMQGCLDVFNKYGIGYDVRIMSAHRTPDDASAFSRNARKNGIKVIIAAAGSAAHLAGVVAAHTTLPVIGVPLASSDLQGMDALLATVQMPAGIPVATVAIGSAGATNAALLAMQILGVSSKKIATLLDAHKKDMVEKVKAKNVALKKKLKAQ